MQNEHQLTDIARLANPMLDSIQRATAPADTMRLADPMRESIQRATALADTMRLTDPMRESIQRIMALTDTMRLADPMRESIQRATTLADTMRLADPMRESIQRATTLADTMRRADPMRESIQRITALTDTMRLADPMRRSIQRTTALADELKRSSVFERFQSIGMATAATAVGISDPAAFASVWQSPQISALTGRFIQDPAFKRDFLDKLKDWKFEDLTEDSPDGETVLSTIEEAIELAGVAEPLGDSVAITEKLIAIWADLPAGLRQMVGAFIVGLILLIIEYCYLLPTLQPQEPATQQKIREQRKLATYAINELGVNSTAFRVAAAENLPVYADHRRDANRIGNLELGQTVEIVQKNRNWCEVIWLAPNSETRGGWVQTRYLRRL